MSFSHISRRYRAGEIHRDVIGRALAEVETVFCPTWHRGCDGGLLTYGIPGGERQELYTCADRAPYRRGHPLAILDGASALRHIGIFVTLVTVDQGTADELRFGADAVPWLRQWGRTVQMERWLEGAEVPARAALMRSFRSWLTLLDEETGDPLREGGAVVVFTGPDALRAWRGTHPEGLPCELRSRELAALLEDEPRAVVNPAGPRGPISLLPGRAAWLDAS